MLSRVVEAVLDQHGTHPIVAARAHRGTRGVHGVVLSHRWQGRAVFVLFGRGDQTPWLVVKVDRHRPYVDRLLREHEALEGLTGEPDMEGLVPAPVGMLRLPGATGLVQSGVPGSPLTSVLRRRGGHRPRTAERDHARARDWFRRLRDCGATSTADGRVELDLDRLGEDLADAVPSDARDAPWIGRVRDEARGAGTVRVARVPVHGDLGPSNLLEHRGRLRLVDWESGAPHASPLADAVTFVNHYARATPLPGGKLPTRWEGTRRAFLEDDELGRLSRRTWRGLLEGHGLDAEAADLLLVRTLVDLATGAAHTAHRARGRAMWSGLIGRLARFASERPEVWPPR